MIARWWPWLVLLLTGGSILAVCECWRRRRAYYDAPNYVLRIQVLKAAKPMALPAIQPLVARKVWGRVERFQERMRA